MRRGYRLDNSLVSQRETRQCVSDGFPRSGEDRCYPDASSPPQVCAVLSERCGTLPGRFRVVFDALDDAELSDPSFFAPPGSCV